jgi:insertion element IS1 protein InsB
MLLNSELRRTAHCLLRHLKAFTITCFYTDGWKVYEKLLPKDRHIVSKKGTQRIERDNEPFGEAH